MQSLKVRLFLPYCVSFPPRMSQWARSLQPDAFLSIEFNHEADSPHLVPRAAHTFDAFSAFMQCFDSMFSSSDCHASKQTARRLSNTAEDRGGRSASHDASKARVFNPLSAFRIGLPESLLKGLQAPSGVDFRRPLERSHTFVFERFVYLRTCLNIIAVEGPMRYIQPWSHQQWLQAFRRHQFVQSPAMLLVGRQVCSMMVNIPDCFKVVATDAGLVMVMHGRDNLYATLWTARAE